MITRLAHLCFSTNHTEAMVAFYKDKLGLPLKFTFTTTKSGKVFGYYFDLGNRTFLELFDQELSSHEWNDGQKRILEQPKNGFFGHFCLEVTAIEEFSAQLKARGVEVTPVTVGMDHAKQAWIKDPDGNSIELMEYSDKSPQIR